MESAPTGLIIFIKLMSVGEDIILPIKRVRAFARTPLGFENTNILRFNALAELIHFLCRHSYLSDEVALRLGEAIIKRVVISNADNVAYLVPIKVRVNAVGGLWLLEIFEKPVAARQVKSLA